MIKFWKKETSDKIYCINHVETPIKFKTEVRKKFSIRKLKYKEILFVQRQSVCKNCNSIYKTTITSSNFDKSLSIDTLINELLPLINKTWIDNNFIEEGPIIIREDNNLAPSAPIEEQVTHTEV